MTKKTDGGPAFPPFHGPGSRPFGMTMSDWFAGMALQGLLSAWGQHDVCDERDIAQSAYSFADAMLKARGER